MAKLVKTLFTSIAAIALAAMLFVAGTYALFTDTITVTNHLQAGTLEATLTRVTLTGNVIDGNGFLVDYEGDENVDFSDPSEENMFDLDNTNYIVPGMYRTAEMKLSNQSTVAFAYWIEIVLTDPTLAEDIALSEQLEVTVTTANDEVGVDKKPIENAGTNKIELGTQAAPIGIVTTGGSQNFTVTVTFKDYGTAEDNVNNNAKEANISFDMIVHAVQVTKA